MLAPTLPIDPSYYQQDHHSVVMAPFTDLRTKQVLLPVPQDIVGCMGCVRKTQTANFNSCVQLPACGGVTFVKDTAAARRMVVLTRLGVQP